LSLFPLLMWEFYHSFFSLGIYFEAVLFTYWTAPNKDFIHEGSLHAL